MVGRDQDQSLRPCWLPELPPAPLVKLPVHPSSQSRQHDSVSLRSVYPCLPWMLAMLASHLIQSPYDIGIVSISIPFLKIGKVRPREDDAPAAGRSVSK